MRSFNNGGICLRILGSDRTMLNTIVMQNVMKFMTNILRSVIMNTIRWGWIMTKSMIMELGSNMSTSKGIRNSNKLNKTSEKINTTESMKGNAIIISNINLPLT
jgi:hypothetical protein